MIRACGCHAGGGGAEIIVLDLKKRFEKAGTGIVRAGRCSGAGRYWLVRDQDRHSLAQDWRRTQGCAPAAAHKGSPASLPPRRAYAALLETRLRCQPCDGLAASAKPGPLQS